MLDGRAKLLQKEQRIHFTASDAVLNLLIERGGFDPKLGARPMRHAIAREFENPLAEEILSGRIRAGDHVRIDVMEGQLVFESLASLDDPVMDNAKMDHAELERS